MVIYEDTEHQPLITSHMHTQTHMHTEIHLNMYTQMYPHIQLERNPWLSVVVYYVANKSQWEKNVISLIILENYSDIMIKLICQNLSQSSQQYFQYI
jgi:hypothetical protein